MKRKFGAQSMVGKLKRALIHRPGAEFSDEKNFRNFGFTGDLPILKEAQAEHDAFSQALIDFGVEVEFLDEVERQYTGSTYITDNGIITDQGAIISRLGKEQRQGEEKAIAKKLLEMDIPILYTMQAPATIEGGGETIWLDHDTLLVGNTFRTNQQGFEQLKSLLGSKVDVIQFQLPYYKGKGTVLHLGSLMSMISNSLCVAYLPLMPIEMYNLLQDRGIEIIPISEAEFARSASNILAVEPEKVIMIEGNPETQHHLENYGVEIKTIPGRWTGYGRCAGPTCMTMSVYREY